jgi:hypothetical protein
MGKISGLTALTGAGTDTAADLIPVVDMSETGNARNKKQSYAEFLLALREGIQDIVGALITAGTGVTVNYDDGAGTVTISTTSIGSGDITGFNEAVDDRVAALITAGAGVTKTYNDGAGTLTISASAFAIEVQDEGVTETASLELINFVGAGVSVTNDGSGGVEVTIAGGSSYTDEEARDAIGTALTVSGALNKAVSDGSDTITISQGVVSTETGTSYTADIDDANAYIRFTSGSAIGFTIPPNSSVAFPVGTVIEVEQGGAGALSFVAGSGVTLNSRSSDLTLAGQYAVAFAKKVATDTWTVNGDL